MSGLLIGTALAAPPFCALIGTALAQPRHWARERCAQSCSGNCATSAEAVTGGVVVYATTCQLWQCAGKLKPLRLVGCLAALWLLQ
jgi:hypothetical protein